MFFSMRIGTAAKLTRQGASPARQTAKHQVQRLPHVGGAWRSILPWPAYAGQPTVTALRLRLYLPYEPVVPVEVPAPEPGEAGEVGEVGEVVLLEPLEPLELPLLMPDEPPVEPLVPPEAPLELDLLK